MLIESAVKCFETGNYYFVKVNRGSRKYNCVFFNLLFIRFTFSCNRCFAVFVDNNFEEVIINVQDIVKVEVLYEKETNK